MAGIGRSGTTASGRLFFSHILFPSSPILCLSPAVLFSFRPRAEGLSGLYGPVRPGPRHSRSRCRPAAARRHCLQGDVTAGM